MSINPSKKQLEFLDWEFGVFFHFGIRSFYHGRKDWDGNPMPASGFNPKHLDCKQWVRTAKEAGAKYCILTCKHHDGFANWPSKYSDYSVKDTPWEDGKGDVVKLFVSACRLYNMKVGLYYSPAQWGGGVKFDDPVKYDDYFINQISELLTNYGKIDYLWFDGCGSENHEFDKTRIIKVIRKLQPDISIFCMWDPETRWVGNEDGYANMPNVNLVSQAALSVICENERELDEMKYLPAECDMRIRDETWFDCEYNEDTIKSVDELMGIYDYSIGRSANLLVNVGPNSDGVIPEADAKRLIEFGKEIKRRYGHPLEFSDVIMEDGVAKIRTPDWTDAGYSPVSLGATLVDTVIIEEDIAEGQTIEEFRIMAALPICRKAKICVFCGKTIGHKAICHFSTIKTAEISVEILKSSGEAKIKSVKAFKIN